MKLRSLLFVPGDRPERMVKALALGADALILDLEDSVMACNKQDARLSVINFLQKTRASVQLYVRINPLDGDQIDADLRALRGVRLDGVMLPKAQGAASIAALASRLDAIGHGSTKILPVATETPAAIFQLGSYIEVADRLHGVTWGAEDLPAAIGAISARESDGRYTAPYELARSLTLFAAAAANVAPIETVFPDFRDLDGLKAYAQRAARDGFTGMMAIHPTQIAVINAAFSPSPEALTHARLVVAAFSDEPAVGVLQIDGKMIDAPHLKQARLILERAGETE